MLINDQSVPVATEADLVNANRTLIQTPEGTKQAPGDIFAPNSVQNNLAGMELLGFSPNAGMSLSGGVGSTVDDYAHQSNGNYYYETECLAGDAFLIVGVGGVGLRLWAFLDSSRKILSVADSNASAASGVVVRAQSNGFLCVNCNSSSGKVFKLASNVTENTDKNFVRDYAELARIDILNVASGSINTNVGFGNVVTLTPSSSTTYVNQVVDVNKGDRFFVSGVCGTNPRLWAFVDSSNKIVSVYTGNETGGVTESEIDAPFDGKLIVNFAKAYPCTLAKIDLSAYIAKREKSLQEIIKRVDDVSAVELTNWGINSSYNTSGAVGSVVTMSPTQSNTCKSLVTGCKAGDKFIVKGTGATNPRLWCFVDSSNKILSHSDSEASAPDGIELTAPADGKLIVNIKNTSSVYKVISLISDRVYPVLSKTVDDCKTLALVQKNDWVNECYIKTNLSYGATVSLTPVTSTNYRHMVVNCKAGDAVYVKANGGEAPRSWTYINSSNEIVSAILNAVAQSELIKIYAPVDGKLIVNDNINTPMGLVLVSDASAKQAMEANLDERVAAIENELPPNTVFEIGHELPNVASYIEGFDYSTSALEKTILEQVYTAFDSLVSDYPDYVSKVDAAEEAGIEYPEYANGYDGVPAYKMYMYKFVSSFVGAGNENGVNPKKKLFIIAGQHGDETAAPANAYIFAKKLCEASDDNFFKLRTCYDVYIIPCVNGFGLHKLTRVNGNGVDLNRNYPIEHWHVTGTPGDSNYSGASAGSEFETQVVCSIFESLSPNIAIDHHNYSDDSGGQFYMTSSQKFMTKIAHQFLEDCSFTFIKDLPEYFGTAYQLFKKNVTTNLPASVANPNDATAARWFFENGAECGMTVEMSRCINYYGGTAVSTGQGKDLYGASTFSVGQYTLAGILFKVAGYIIGR